MMIANVIAKADSEHVIYFLLGAYLEATQFGKILPESVTDLPVDGLHDIENRYDRLISESAKYSDQRNEKVRLEFDEALQIFDTAVRRLKFLERDSDAFTSISRFGTRSARAHSARR